MRGRVIRALDTAAGVDPDGASRYLGSLQGDTFQEHAHTEKVSNGLFGVYVAPDFDVNTGYTNSSTGTTGAIAYGTYGNPRISTETRMTNCAFDCYIVY